MRIYLIIAIVLLVVSCVQKNKKTEQAAVIDERVFEVAEVVQASGYTYLNVKENSEEKWMAVTKQDVQPGEVFYYDEALQMTNFHSKDLDRTFEVIYFVNQISKTPILNHPATGMNGMEGMTGENHSGKIEPGKKSSIQLNKSKEEVTVAQIYQNKDNLKDKEIEIRGVVVKINKGIMGKNWIHLQDGTGSNGNYDLTVTTQDLAEVNEEVSFKGRITLNKDFGSGYFYEVIMEDAVLINKSTVSLHSN